MEIAHKSNWALRHHKDVGQLSTHLFNKLKVDISAVRTQELYFLRKVHKLPHRLRPICSCSSGPTEKLSGFICRKLTPHLEDVKSLVSNSQQVVQIVERMDLSANTDVMLVSLDVESLYPSIPQAAGIEMVLQRVVPTIPPTTTYNSYKNMLRDFLRVVIRDNHFRFNDRYYDQVRGVAMGTRCAPPFANLFLAALEEKALADWEGSAPALWLRFLDDVLMLWTSTQDRLDQFLLHLNSQMSSIKFTSNSSQQSTTFLDLQLYKGSRFWSTGVLDIKLFVKPTNPQQFLHFSSCHPAHTFSTIIKGELLRAIRCTSNKAIYVETVPPSSWTGATQSNCSCRWPPQYPLNKGADCCSRMTGSLFSRILQSSVLPTTQHCTPQPSATSLQMTKLLLTPWWSEGDQHPSRTWWSEQE